MGITSDACTYILEILRIDLCLILWNYYSNKVRSSCSILFPMACTHTHVRQASTYNYSSPPSTMNDGVFQIMVVRGSLSRYRLALILLGLNTGAHADMYGVEWIACTEYQLQVHPAKKRTSYFNIDGENISTVSSSASNSTTTLRARIVPTAMTYFGDEGGRCCCCRTNTSSTVSTETTTNHRRPQQAIHDDAKSKEA